MAAAAWRESLRDAPPSAFPRRPDVTSSPTPSALLRRKIVVGLKRRPAISIETVLQTAWALVNVRYSDSDDVVYGLAVVETDEDEHGDVVEGSQRALTSLPARFTLQPGQTVQACLEAVAKRTAPLVSALVSQSASGESIAALGPNYLAAAAFDNQLVIFTDMMSTQDVVLNRALNVECTLGRQGVMARAFYDPVVVDAVSVQRILATFEALIHQLDDDTNLSKAVEDLSPLSPEDLAQLCEWNRTVTPAAENCMHHLVARQVRERPQAEAVCGLGVSFTFEELDALADSLAHVLVGKGVGPGSVVPYMFDKSAWTVVAMLGTLKAGGAFVPLDTAHQWSDTQGILEACGATLVLCSETYAERFASHGTEAIVVSQSSLSSLPRSGPVSSSVAPSDPGYVIFTSGSTGKPKGIVCSHRAWCTNALSHGVAELNGPSTRALQFSAYTFDISISDIFTTLTFGGCSCVPTEAERMNDLGGAINRMRVTQVAVTPTVAQFLRPDDVPTLRVLVCGGEAMSADFLATWAPRVKLMNSYGPAECTSRIACAWKAVSDEGAVIGTAIGGVMWVCQSDNPDMLAPIGAVGELLVEGHVLADGYLANPAKTREAFIDKPEWLRAAFPGRAAGRVYRTGDLVQYTSSGALRFLGRRDTQIKIHGVRLECGHVEAKIAAELEADASVVVEKVVAAEKTLLAAFLALPRFAPPQGSPETTTTTTLLENTQEIRTFLYDLQQKLLAELPSYMVPNIFLPVSAIPLGATGKVNRRALQALAKSLPEESLTQFTAARDGDVADGDKPSTKTEVLLSQLWASVLKVSPLSISRQDSFFRLGGDSVSAMKLVAAATTSGANLSLSVADVFQHPELAQLGAHLYASAVARVDLEPIEYFSLIGGAAKFQSLREHLSRAYRIAARRVEDIFPCTPMQAGMMAETIASPEAYILQEVLRLSPDVDVERLQAAWEDRIAECSIMRTRIVMLPQLGSCQIVMTEDEPVDWRQGDDLAAYLREDLSAHMGYGDALSRLAIVEERSGARFLVWTCHHAVTDGHNHQNMLRLAEQAYGGGQLGRGTEFKQFVKYLGDQDAEKSKQYWREQFANLGAVAKFPVFDDAYEPTVTDYVHHTIALPRTAGITSSILLRASWAFVLSRITGSGDVVLGVTQSGRDIPLAGIDSCLGPVLASVPVRVSMEDAATVSCGQFLSRVQEQYVGMIPHQHVGAQNIRRASPEAADACDFHSLLVVQPAPGEPSRLFVPTEHRNAGDQLNFGLLLECLLGGDGTVTVRAGFDKTVISAGEVELLVHRLEHVVAQLGAPDSRDLPLTKINITSPGTSRPSTSSTRRCRPSSSACTGSSRSMPSSGPTPWPWTRGTPSSRSASCSNTRTAWRGVWSSWASGPRSSSRSRSRRARGPWSAFTPSSARAAPASRSTWRTRGRGTRGSWPTPRQRSSSRAPSTRLTSTSSRTSWLFLGRLSGLWPRARPAPSRASRPATPPSWSTRPARPARPRAASSSTAAFARRAGPTRRSWASGRARGPSPSRRTASTSRSRRMSSFPCTAAPSASPATRRG